MWLLVVIELKMKDTTSESVKHIASGGHFSEIDLDLEDVVK